MPPLNLVTASFTCNCTLLTQPSLCQSTRPYTLTVAAYDTYPTT
jgi:hypothetical protein